MTCQHKPLLLSHFGTNDLSQVIYIHYQLHQVIHFHQNTYIDKFSYLAIAYLFSIMSQLVSYEIPNYLWRHASKTISMKHLRSLFCIKPSAILQVHIISIMYSSLPKVAQLVATILVSRHRDETGIKRDNKVVCGLTTSCFPFSSSVSRTLPKTLVNICPDSWSFKFPLSNFSSPSRIPTY